MYLNIKEIIKIFKYIRISDQIKIACLISLEALKKQFPKDIL